MLGQTNPTFKAPSPRYKIMEVSPEMFFEMTLNGRKSTELPDGNVLIHTISHTGIPEGTQVAAVMFDEYKRCFAFRLWNETWPEVEPGKSAPNALLLLSLENYVLVPKKPDDNDPSQRYGMQTLYEKQELPQSGTGCTMYTDPSMGWWEPEAKGCITPSELRQPRQSGGNRRELL